MQEAVTKTGIVRAVEELGRTILLDKDYEKILNLLQYCLFDTYIYELNEKLPSKSALKDKPEALPNGNEELLTQDDIISKSIVDKEGLFSNKHHDFSGCLVKDIFLNIFFRESSIVKKPYSEKIIAEFEQEKETLIDDDIEKKSIKTEAIDVDIQTKTEEELKDQLLKSFVRKYENHINIIENNYKKINVSIENEFVRHYAFFWITLKLLEDKKYNYGFTFNDFVWSNLYFATSLINKVNILSLSHYIKSKKYIYEEGFFLGTCSLLTGFCMIDKHLKKDIKDRFGVYEKRKEDFIFIINKLLFLTFILQLGDKFFIKAEDFIHRNYSNLNKHISKVSDDLDFNYIMNKVGEVQDIIHILELDKTRLTEFKGKKVIDDIKRGDLILLNGKRIFLVKDIKEDSLDVYYGIGDINKTNKITASLHKQSVVKIEKGDNLKDYFFELLETKKSNWDLIF